jgi:hypothetical protein
MIRISFFYSSGNSFFHSYCGWQRKLHYRWRLLFQLQHSAGGGSIVVIIRQCEKGGGKIPLPNLITDNEKKPASIYIWIMSEDITVNKPFPTQPNVGITRRCF